MTTPNPFGENPFAPKDGPTGVAPGPQPPVARDEPNTLATLSVVFAFVFAPAGALLGQLGLWQIAHNGQRGRERALVGVTLSYAFITTAVVALVVWAALRDSDVDRQPVVPSPSATASAPTSTSLTTATTTPPPPPPTVAPTGLEGLLPTVQEVEAIPGLSGRMELRGQESALIDRRANNVTITPAECYAAYGEADTNGYDASAVRGVQVNGFKSALKQGAPDQSVAAYDNAEAARSGLQKLLDIWRSCGRAPFSYSDPSGGGRVATWTVSAPADAGNGITTVTATPIREMTGQMCRAIAVKANVVIDVATSAVGGVDHMPATIAIANLILNKIPGPR